MTVKTVGLDLAIWTAKLLDQKPFRLATVAMANKFARIIWAILTKGEEYRQPIV